MTQGFSDNVILKDPDAVNRLISAAIELKPEDHAMYVVNLSDKISQLMRLLA